MIRYALRCPEGHEFESWFQSAAAFDRLCESGMISCAVCGATGVEKALMAPRVAAARDEAGGPEGGGPLSRPAHPAEIVLRALKRHIREHTEDVGERFAEEARAIHLGEAPRRGIRGKAAPDEARALREEGIPVAPIPFPLDEN
ncbi:MAG: DUF1178 family protein [Alphaproteobacteria bacterium]|nr:MAG: DUF1178 family protein [Alphaproteobacteria bacterium]